MAVNARTGKTVVFPVFIRYESSEPMHCIFETEPEAAALEAQLTATGRFELVTWEEDLVHDPDGTWTPDDPLFVVTEGYYAVTLGVFARRKDADALRTRQPPGATIHQFEARIGQQLTAR